MALSLLQKALIKAFTREEATTPRNALITTWAKRDVKTVPTALLNMTKSFNIYQKKIMDELTQIGVARLAGGPQ